MKYRLRIYRDALLAALADAPEDRKKKIAERFGELLVREKALAKSGEIMKMIREKHLERLGRKEVLIESASPLGASHRRAIKDSFAEHTLFLEAVNPDLIAGVRITINDRICVDATAKKMLDEIFIHS